jgi:hypothetical protein
MKGKMKGEREGKNKIRRTRTEWKKRNGLWERRREL